MFAYSDTGVPGELMRRLAEAAVQRQPEQVRRAIDAITERADEAISHAMYDTWHWRRFQSELHLVEPELLAVGVLVAAALPKLAATLHMNAAKPAAIAVAVGAQLCLLGPVNEEEH